MFKFKKGNKIHIKKANRGKFTDYCGGEVTNECIQRGKHSSNPAVRKRATFAANARKWKHKEGGQIQRLQLGNYFKKPIKWLAHQINDYGNTKQSSYPTGTAFVYAISDERKKHPELTYQQAAKKVQKQYNQNRKNIGLPTETTPSQSAAGLAVTGGVLSPWFAVPDIIFDAAASIDEPSTSNNLHTIADFPETVAKFTPSKIDDYVARGVQMLGNVDDTLSAGGKNLFGIFDRNHGQINNTVDKTLVRESTRVHSPKRIESVKRKKLGGIVKADNGIKFTINDGLTLGSQLIGNIANSVQQNKFIDSQIKANKAQNEYLKSQIWNNSLSKAKEDQYTKQFKTNQKEPNSGVSINESPTVVEHSIWDMASRDANNQISNLNNQTQLDNQKLLNQKQSILGSALGTAANYGINYLQNKYGSDLLNKEQYKQ